MSKLPPPCGLALTFRTVLVFVFLLRSILKFVPRMLTPSANSGPPQIFELKTFRIDFFPSALHFLYWIDENVSRICEAWVQSARAIPGTLHLVTYPRRVRYVWCIWTRGIFLFGVVVNVTSFCLNRIINVRASLWYWWHFHLKIRF